MYPENFHHLFHRYDPVGALPATLLGMDVSIDAKSIL
jgi:hypothetical protein